MLRKGLIIEFHNTLRLVGHGALVKDYNWMAFTHTNFTIHISIWTTTWQNQQNECAASEDSDQPGHPPSLIRVFYVRMKKAWVLSYPLSAQRRLIRLGGCPGWSESSLGAHSFCWYCHVAAHLCDVVLKFHCDVDAFVSCGLSLNQVSSQMLKFHGTSAVSLWTIL